MTPSNSAWCALLLGSVRPARHAGKISAPAVSRRFWSPSGAAAAATMPLRNATARPAASLSPHVNAALADAIPARAHVPEPRSYPATAPIQSLTCFPPPSASFEDANAPRGDSLPPPPLLFMLPMRRCPVSPLPRVLRPNVPSGTASSSRMAEWSRARSRVTLSPMRSSITADPPPVLTPPTATAPASNTAPSSSSRPPPDALPTPDAFTRLHEVTNRSCMCGRRCAVSAACHVGRLDAGHRPSTGLTSVCSNTRTCLSCMCASSWYAAAPTALATAWFA
mmetsp:Transcript_5527/g.24842  ORF Transcript_5527/g.24842 Transcript_5527/m.24842 type:complete len:280 (-) Transcript_5527:3159-3998(-)